jgi:hypothetical protein
VTNTRGADNFRSLKLLSNALRRSLMIRLIELEDILDEMLKEPEARAAYEEERELAHTGNRR